MSIFSWLVVAMADFAILLMFCAWQVVAAQNDGGTANLSGEKGLDFEADVSRSRWHNN